MLETNKIYQGDCLELMKQIPDKSIDLVLTDPPYGINYQSNMRVKSDKFEFLSNDNNNFRFSVYPEFYRVLKDNTVAVIFCSFKNYAIDYLELSKYFDIKNTIIWHKPGGGIGDLFHSLSTDYEMAIVAHKGNCEIKSKRYGSVWKIDKVNPNKMVHPTEKPIPLMKIFLECFAEEDSIVLDPFAGSGSTLGACKLTGRNFIGIELEPKYVDIANKRIADFKQQLVLV